MGSCSASAVSTGKYSSMREIPVNPKFIVISTALVLQGVIISRRGPMKIPSRVLSSNAPAPLKSQVSFSMSLAENTCAHSTANTLFSLVLKNCIITVL